MSDEITRLSSELNKSGEEKSKSDWRIGELLQFWNDAKWRYY